MNLIIAALSIFLLRLLDRTLGTLRILYVNKGRPGLGAGLGFVESAIWVVAISRVIQDLNDPFFNIRIFTWICSWNYHWILYRIDYCNW